MVHYLYEHPHYKTFLQDIADRSTQLILADYIAEGVCEGLFGGVQPPPLTNFPSVADYLEKFAVHLRDGVSSHKFSEAFPDRKMWEELLPPDILIHSTMHTGLHVSRTSSLAEGELTCKRWQRYRFWDGGTVEISMLWERGVWRSVDIRPFTLMVGVAEFKL